MKYSTVIFDLDGTLLNTLYDITGSLNRAFEEAGYHPDFTLEDLKTFIGSGVRVLVKRACARYDLDEELYEKIYKSYMDDYKINCLKDTIPYEGVNEVLRQLKDHGYHLGVISNKPDRDTQKCIAHYFPSVFDYVVGNKEGMRIKPYPDVFLHMEKEYSLDRKTILYAGDMQYDIDFASALGIDMVFCEYGYGKLENVKGYQYHIKKMEDILALLKE